MRDLANLSAQTALDRHAQDRHRRAVRTKLSMALLGTVFGSLMTFLWWRGHADTGLLTGTAGYLVALVWGLQYAVLKRKSPA